jgi:hypothetical protein
MPEIREEVFIFILAVLSGMIVRLAYRCISCLRQVIKHHPVIVGIEDLLYWSGSAIYIFVQIYYTSDGSIRWYFVLGIVLGAILMTFFVRIFGKMSQKIYRQKKKDFVKKS